MPDNAPNTPAWPTELRLRKRDAVLEIDFDDGARYALRAEYLRVESPSAEVKGHGPATRKTVGGKRAVTITHIEPVGNYAVRLTFDDGHDTGLYTWDYLYKLGRDEDRIWNAYLKALDDKGLTREPA